MRSPGAPHCTDPFCHAYYKPTNGRAYATASVVVVVVCNVMYCG